jgi:hypothetical protein
MVLIGTMTVAHSLAMVTQSPDGKNEESPRFPKFLFLKCGYSIVF